jgi:hypothetical protein
MPVSSSLMSAFHLAWTSEGHSFEHGASVQRRRGA